MCERIRKYGLHKTYEISLKTYNEFQLVAFATNFAHKQLDNYEKSLQKATIEAARQLAIKH
jgi:capsule polysaccharide export protein KpsE/RkpR